MKKIILIIVSYISLVAGIMFICMHISNKDQPKKIIFHNEQDELLFRQVIGKPEGQLNMDDAIKGLHYFRNIFLHNVPYRINFETGEISETEEMIKTFKTLLNKEPLTFRYLNGLVDYYNQSTGDNLTTDEILRAMTSLEIIEEDEKVEKFNKWCNTQEKDAISNNQYYYIKEIFPYEKQ